MVVAGKIQIELKLTSPFTFLRNLFQIACSRPGFAQFRLYFSITPFLLVCSSSFSYNVLIRGSYFIMAGRVFLLVLLAHEGQYLHTV